MGRARLALATLAAALAPAAAQAQDAEAIVLEPASAWNATYDAGLCRLARMFTADGQQHALVFEQAAPEARFNMSVAGPGLKEVNGGLTLQLAFGPGGEPNDQAIVKQANPEFGTVVFLKDIALNPEAVDAASGTEGIGFAVSMKGIDTADAEALRQITLSQGQQTFVFRTGPLAAPFSVLNDCTSHILSTWGLDAAAHRDAQRSTRILNVKKISRSILESYPLQARMESRGGVVGVAVLVDEQGAATECRITNDSGDRNLDLVACEGVMQARFDPALDAEGKPMKSYWMTRITYRIAN